MFVMKRFISIKFQKFNLKTLITIACLKYKKDQKTRCKILTPKGIACQKFDILDEYNFGVLHLLHPKSIFDKIC